MHFWRRALVEMTGEFIGTTQCSRYASISTGRGQTTGAAESGSVYSWVPKHRTTHLHFLMERVKKLQTAVEHIDEQKWRTWLDLPRCETEFPASDLHASDSFSHFQRLLLVKALRPDRLMNAISVFINSILGSSPSSTTSSSTPSSNREDANTNNQMARVLSESSASSPILFITTPGSDPSLELRDFASKTIGLSSFFQVRFNILCHCFVRLDGVLCGAHRVLVLDCHGTRSR